MRETVISFHIYLRRRQTIRQMAPKPCSAATSNAPWHLRPGDPALPDVLSLIRAAFAGMDGRVSPPSSVHRLTRADLDATTCEVWAIGTPPVACVVLTPLADTLYLGKLAVAPAARRHGAARALVETAVMRALALGLSSVTAQVRIALTQNQIAFARMGFVEVARTAHSGFDRPTSITYVRPVRP